MPSWTTRTSRNSASLRPTETRPTSTTRPGWPLSARCTAQVWTAGVRARTTTSATSAARLPRIMTVSLSGFMRAERDVKGRLLAIRTRETSTGFPAGFAVSARSAGAACLPAPDRSTLADREQLARLALFASLRGNFWCFGWLRQILNYQLAGTWRAIGSAGAFYFGRGEFFCAGWGILARFSLQFGYVENPRSDTNPAFFR